MTMPSRQADSHNWARVVARSMFLVCIKKNGVDTAWTVQRFRLFKQP